MNLVKEDLLGIQKDRMKIGASLADVDPMHIDKTVSCRKDEVMHPNAKLIFSAL